jgi:hypothetical protein
MRIIKLLSFYVLFSAGWAIFVGLLALAINSDLRRDFEWTKFGSDLLFAWAIVFGLCIFRSLVALIRN